MVAVSQALWEESGCGHTCSVPLKPGLSYSKVAQGAWVSFFWFLAD